MSERTKRAISELTGFLEEPDGEELGMRILLAEFTAVACTQKAMKARATEDAIQSLSARLAKFPRDQWAVIRDASEEMVRRTTYEKDTPASLATFEEVWDRVTRGGQ